MIMDLSYVLQVIEKAKSENVTDKILDGYEYCIKEVVKKYPSYYRDKKYAKVYK